MEAHILVCFLTLTLWRTLEMWMRSKGLGNCSRQLLKEVATVRSLDVVLPVKEIESQQTREVRLRVVARPDRLVAALLVRLGLELPRRRFSGLLANGSRQHSAPPCPRGRGRLPGAGSIPNV